MIRKHPTRKNPKSEIVDISARRKAEEALKLNEEFLRGLFDNMLDAILILDWDGTILFGNNAAAALVGFNSPDEGIGRNFAEFIHPGSLEKAVRNLMLARQGRGNVLDEHEIITTGGERKIVEAIGREIPFRGKTADIIGLRDITMRRKAEEALRESEDVFRILVSNMLDCLLIIDLEGNIIFANEAALKLGEIDSMQDVIGRRIDRFLSRSDSRKAFRFLYKKYLDFVYEFKIRTGKGNEKYVETLGNPIRFKGEQALILNLRDITERKKAEHSLMEAYSSLQNEIREREEAERALDNYRVHLEAMVGERTAELRRANEMLEMEIAERQKSEQKIKDLNMLLLSTKRITESLLRANTEEELFQTTCGLLAELDFIELVWAGFAETEHFHVKPVAWSGREEGYLSSVKITWDDSEYGRGPTGTAVRTGWISTVMDIETDPSFGPWREEALKRGYLSAIALPISSREEITGYLTVYSGEKDAFGIEEVEFLTQIAEDIAVGVKSLRMERELESKHIELQKAYAELQASEEMVIQQEKLASIGQLAAGIAHEIKNPLAIVLQGTEYMKSCVDDEFLADAADRIKNSINRADGIIRGLLSFSRQAGIDLKLGNISEVLNESVALVSHQLTCRNMKVVRDFASVEPTRFDRNQMKQVFINLLLNAIEAIESWGEIKIELRESTEKSREVMIRISDNGCGMNRDTASRIFDPFFTTKRNSGGTGLGMSISKGIIEKHNGRISVESAVGTGTQVSIFLPQGAVH